MGMKIEIEIPEDIYDGIKNNNLKHGTFITLLNAVLRGKVRVQGSGRTKKEEMTTDEAIDLLDNLIGMLTDNNGSDYDAALEKAIEALDQAIENEKAYHLGYCAGYSKAKVHTKSS